MTDGVANVYFYDPRGAIRTQAPRLLESTRCLDHHGDDGGRALARQLYKHPLPPTPSMSEPPAPDEPLPSMQVLVDTHFGFRDHVLRNERSRSARESFRF